MHRGDGSIKTVRGASNRHTVWTGRKSLADMDCHNEVGSTAVLMNQCAGDSSLTYATIDGGYQLFT